MFPRLNGLVACLAIGMTMCSVEPSTMTEPQIHLDPARPATDQSFVTRVVGLDPGASVRLELRTQSAQGGWNSAIRVVADDGGTVDLGRDAPVEGSYEGVDAMGLVWSLSWEGRDPAAPPDFGALSTMTLRVFGDDDDAPLVAHTFTRASCFETVALKDVSSDRMRALHVRPPGQPTAAALVLGGSEGGRPTLAACSLAAYGIETLGLAYFGEEGLPEQLVEIPLEYVEQGLERLLALSGRSAVAVIGFSKGAELAALLASRRPGAVRSLVLYAPSAVVFQGIDRSGSTEARSSWSEAGTPVPFVPLQLAAIDVANTPIRFFESYDSPLDALSTDDPARIAFEAIDAPIMTIAGTDDALWPSARMAEMIHARRGRRQDDVRLTYPGAGHGVFLPYWPTTGVDPDIALGGNSAATAAGAADSWPRVLAFLSAHSGT
jgi:dienelactone hydrolase